MTQTYINEAAVHWMRLGLCPECGHESGEHATDNRFWLPRRLACDLTQQGVIARIKRQREIDEDLEEI